MCIRDSPSFSSAVQPWTNAVNGPKIRPVLEEFIMRKLGWLGVLAAVMALSIYTSAPVSGQQQTPQAMPRQYGTPPPMVITAFGGKPVTYKAPRTPWGDPDLQGVWSSDDMEGVGIGVQQGGGRGRGGPGAPPAPQAAPSAAPAGPPPLYRTCLLYTSDAADER